MGLSRLSNFLKSGRGTILYVDPSSLDSTDSIENSGNSLTRPFKSLQRALVEAARFSYQSGQRNDRFNKTTIVLYPGDHLVDNRPGYIPTGPNTFSTRGGSTNISDLTQWDLDTVYDLSAPDNTLYKLNSIYGGIIIPRGTSIVGMDLRKTRIRPTYVPNPENDAIERSCVFRTTGACYFWQFTILDADPNGLCYKDYTSNLFVPNFSHHKLTGFEYADGVNPVNIKDDFLTYSDPSRTDLDMYYEKIARVYGPTSGREIKPDFGEGVIDIQPVIDEYRIVGSTGGSVGITNIRAGDGITPTTTITVDIEEPVDGLSVDSPIQISGVNASQYDGQFVVFTVISDTQFTYQVQNIPTNPLPGVTGATLNLVTDTVTSASPYIFNISLRSVYGMCGLLADGDKATGFKSMVVAQYTGIGLQKDDNAFVKYDTSGEYKDLLTFPNLHTNSRSRFKPSYENFHMKATNDSFLQLVSVFAIGYAQHFVTENGGDIALNNSNSNFGAKSLVSKGFKRTAFTQDDQGYITHIIPPKENESEEITVEFNSIDVGITTSVGVSSHLYLYDQTNENILPKVVVDGYHVGAKRNEELNVQVFENGSINTYSSRVVMPSGPYNPTQSSSEKVFTVARDNVGINDIDSVSNTLTLTEDHSFINGESIRIIADNGHLPDGLESDQVYFVITQESAGISTNEIRIAKTLSDAINGSSSASAVSINNKGGILNIISRVSDKSAGDIGHPVQWDDGQGQWYINVATTNNEIYDTINTSGVSGLGNATTRPYIIRKPDSRSLIDTLYRVRYVLPKQSAGRPPLDGFILQESNDNVRNPSFIANASWSSNTATIVSEVPHKLKVGSQVEIVNVLPIEYNGTYTVTSVPSAKEFSYTLTTNPGTFGNNTDARDASLPYFKRKKYATTYQIYRTQEILSYINGIQDGVYYLTLINHSNYPTVAPFREQALAQSIENLYPQTNNDNSNSDPDASSTHALPDLIGKVVVDDPQNSITKETLESFIVGYGITDIQSSSETNHTIFTSIDHRFSGITTVSVVSAGANYGSGSLFSGELYNAQLVGFAGSTTGLNATAQISVVAGEIAAVKIIDGGSAYGIGNTLSVVGVASTAGFIAGVVRVESISNNIEDTLKIAGVSSATNLEYNTLYRISEITTGKSKEINVVSSEPILTYSSAGLGLTSTVSSSYIPTGKALLVSSLSYNSVTGLATVGFTTSHGFQVDNKIRISDANESAFNGDFIVKRLNSLESLVVNVGVSVTTSTSATGTLYAYRPILTSYAGDLIKDTENISGRLNYEYAGITGILGAQYTTTSTGALTIPNAVALGFNLDDYLLINNEIFRINSAVTTDTVSVLRALLGSPRQTHVTGSVIRKVSIRPVELRRNSIIRASGHTFEYLGYGPGNYSTSFPDKQDRVLTSAEKFLAQASKTEGGLIVYTGMDSEGAFYAGNKKVNSATGTEESYDTPIPSITGEKESGDLVNIVDAQKLFVSSSIRVEGGRDNSVVSEFDGPVIFNQKVTTNSDIEANAVLIQGEEEVSRKYSLSDSKPTESGNYGDVYFNSEPAKQDFIGWTYVTENEWEPFGFIGGNGIGIASAGNYVGFATLIDFKTVGLALSTQYTSQTGIATVTFNSSTPRIGVTTSFLNTIVGSATTINFVGLGLTISTQYNSTSGIATIIFDGTAGLIDEIGTGTTNYPGGPLYSLQYNLDGFTFGGISESQYNPNTNTLNLGSIVNVAVTTSTNAFKITQSGTGNALVVEDQSSDLTPFVITNNGAVGIGTLSPGSKLEIISDPALGRSLYIKSTSGTEIVRIDNNVNDTTPFVIDANGRLGINTGTTLADLDVNGNAAVSGALRIYRTNRSNYVGLQVGSINSNLDFTLPTSYGTSGQVLFTNGSGILAWKQVANQEVVAGSGINISYATVGSGITVATISNSGIRSLTAGSNVQISVVNGVGIITSTAVSVPDSFYVFTTKGFSMPV
jgi:hypothetical protein